MDSKEASSTIRMPAVAGKFYSSDPIKLKRGVERYLASAVAPLGLQSVALIVPHAGLIFSGQICADGYRQVQGEKYDTIILLGTNHTTPNLTGAAVFAGSAFRTPLGILPVDEKARATLLSDCADCQLNSEAHLQEHSIEVQLPFLQVLFPQVRILPLVLGIGNLATYERLSASLAKVFKQQRTLMVASSDLAHYPSKLQAIRLDLSLLEPISA
ncbi:MAG: AmmeMemoRadiSam system protein B, partial [Syntrophales bacterium LBB04]|nr:AmmeMemoRadiSam system protein B [Syntrophales bacterium LBB04]